MMHMLVISQFINSGPYIAQIGPRTHYLAETGLDLLSFPPQTSGVGAAGL